MEYKYSSANYTIHENKDFQIIVPRFHEFDSPLITKDTAWAMLNKGYVDIQLVTGEDDSCTLKLEYFELSDMSLRNTGSYLLLNDMTIDIDLFIIDVNTTTDECTNAKTFNLTNLTLRESTSKLDENNDRLVRQAFIFTGVYKEVDLVVTEILDDISNFIKSEKTGNNKRTFMFIPKEDKQITSFDPAIRLDPEVRRKITPPLPPVYI